MVRRVLLILLISQALLVVAPAGADGPWRGQVVDAETGQPIEGVVILAFWTRSEPSLGGWVATQYHASEEVVTGSDGRFVIASRRSYIIPLVIKVQGPEWRVFKPGYGPGPRPGGSPPIDRELSDDGREVTFRLSPARTRAERLEALRGNVAASRVPSDKKPRLLEAINSERVDLGLQRELQ